MTSPRQAIFTTCAPNYLARVAVLMDSAARHLPGHDRFVLVAADDVAADQAPFGAGARLVTPAEVAAPDLELRRRLYNVTEFCTSIKPDVFAHLFAAGYEEVLYLDPDTVFFAPPEAMRRAFDAGAEIVLTPHLVTAADHPEWVLRAVSLSGQFNLGFLGLRRSDAATRALEWWRRRIAFDCVEDARNGVFVDQKIADFFSAFFPERHVIREPGYNVAYWNLHERPLEWRDGEYRVDGGRLTFFHFSGFGLFGGSISRHLPGAGKPAAAVDRILHEYGRAIVARGELGHSVRGYDYNALPDGTRSSHLIRGALRCALDRKAGSPPGPEAGRRLLQPGFLAEPVWQTGKQTYGKPVARLIALLDQAADLPRKLEASLSDYLDAGRHDSRGALAILLKELHREDAVDARMAERIGDMRPPEALAEAMRGRHVDLFRTTVRVPVDDRRGGIELPVFLILLHYTRQDLRDGFGLRTVGSVVAYVAWFLSSGLSSWTLADAAVDGLCEALDQVRLQHGHAPLPEDGTLLDSAILHIFAPAASDEENAPRSIRVASGADALAAVLGTGRRPPFRPRIARALRAWLWSTAGEKVPRIVRVLASSVELRELLLGSGAGRRVTMSKIDASLAQAGLAALSRAGEAPSLPPAAGRRVRPVADDPPDADTVIVGPFGMTSGVAHSAHGVRALLAAAGGRVASRDLLADGGPSATPAGAGAVRRLLLHANADVTLEAAVKFEALWRRAGQRVGYWYWELSRMTERMAAASDLLDEIWVATEFVRAAVAPVVRVPVQVRPPMIAPAAFRPSSPGGGSFGAGKRGFRFLGLMDARSFVMRKNPLGVARAFRNAFPDGDEPVELIVKLSNGHHNVKELAEFRDVAAGDHRIRIIDGILSAVEMNDLYESADCFVSLHRSEGLGLGIVQAMMRQKPVIATAYSGPMDFMNEANAFLVPFRLVPVEPDAYPDWLGQHWAEPDETAAAVYMKQLARNPAAGGAPALRARQDAEAFFSARRTVDLVRRRLRPA